MTGNWNHRIRPHCINRFRVTVAIALAAVAVTYLAAAVAYRPTPMEVFGDTYTPDLLTTIAGFDAMFVVAIAALAVGALVQTFRLIELRYRGLCHPHCAVSQRRWDWVLITLGCVVMWPVVFGPDSSWVYFLYSISGLVMLATSGANIRLTERLGLESETSRTS